MRDKIIRTKAQNWDNGDTALEQKYGKYPMLNSIDTFFVIKDLSRNIPLWSVNQVLNDSPAEEYKRQAVVDFKDTASKFKDWRWK